MKKIVGFDVEGSDKDPLIAKLASIQIYHPDTDETEFIPINMAGIKVDPKPILEEIAEKYLVIGHSLQYDLTMCARHGKMPTPAGDTFYYFNQTPLAASHPRNERGLKPLCEQFNLRSNMARFEDVVPGLDFTKVSPDDQAAVDYANEDPKAAYDLWQYLTTQFPENLESHQEEMKVMPYFLAMTIKGVKLDVDKIPQIEMDLSADLTKIQNKLSKMVGFSFRANSNKDLIPVWEKLGLELPPTTPSGQHSFKSENLDTYKPHPVIELIEEARGLIYIIPRIHNALESYVKNGRLHPKYSQIGWSGAARVYTSSPSTNSLPMAVRAHVIPDKGKKFVYADWAQAEFILACQMAGETEIVQGYFDGDDVMRIAAAKNFNCSIDDVSEDQRDVQKVVQYAAMYGSEGISVSKALKTSAAEGTEKVQKFWESLPKLAILRDFIIKKAHENGFTETLTGFRRFLPLMLESERKAFNSAMQSGVANLFKRAVVQLHEIMPKGCRLVTGVFDSFLLEVPEGMDLETMRPIFEKISTHEANGFDIKFRFTLSEGKNWAEAQGK